MAIIIIIIIIIGTALPAWYAEKGLCNGTVSVVCLSRGSSEEQLCHSPVAGNWAAAARRRSTALSSKRGQCHVYSGGTRLDTDLLWAHFTLVVGLLTHSLYILRHCVPKNVHLF